MVVMMRVHAREHRRKRRIPRHLLVAAPDERGNGVQCAGPFGARQNSFCCVTHGNDLGDIARKIKPRAARGDPAVWPGSPEIRRSYRSAPPLVASRNGRRARMDAAPFGAVGSAGDRSMTPRRARLARKIDLRRFSPASQGPVPKSTSVTRVPAPARPGARAAMAHYTIGPGIRTLLQKSREVQAFSRFSATRLRNWMRREVSSTMTPDCTNCVNVRDTVSMVSPR